jgi:hypothetical protein
MRLNKYDKKEKKELLKWYYGLKDRKMCVNCGNVFRFYQLDYDHLPGKRKFMDVSKMVRMGYGRDKVMAEMSKCQLVCKNCHAHITFTRRHPNG